MQIKLQTALMRILAVNQMNESIKKFMTKIWRSSLQSIFEKILLILALVTDLTNSYLVICYSVKFKSLIITLGKPGDWVSCFERRNLRM